jgi:hypothetical protein
MKAESCGKEEALEGIEQALSAFPCLVDSFIQFGVAQPDFWIPLVELLDRAYQAVSSVLEPSL